MKKTSEEYHYKFYLKDWRASSKVFELTLAQRGLFLELINTVNEFKTDIEWKPNVFARKVNATLEQLTNELSVLIEMELVRKYTRKGNEYLEIPSVMKRIRLRELGRKAGLASVRARENRSNGIPNGIEKPVGTEKHENTEKPFELKVNKVISKQVNKGKNSSNALTKKRGFIKPVTEEVFAYMFEKTNNKELASKESVKFIDFYESKGWLIGKNKMQKWKASASGWLNRELEKRELEEKRTGTGAKTATQKLMDKMDLIVKEGKDEQ